MKNLYSLQAKNNIPHVQCSCKNVFPIPYKKLKVQHHTATRIYQIIADCPYCLVSNTFYLPDEFFSEYFNVIFQTISFNFKSHEEAVAYYINYCKMNQVLETS